MNGVITSSGRSDLSRVYQTQTSLSCGLWKLLIREKPGPVPAPLLLGAYMLHSMCVKLSIDIHSCIKLLKCKLSIKQLCFKHHLNLSSHVKVQGTVFVLPQARQIFFFEKKRRKKTHYFSRNLSRFSHATPPLTLQDIKLIMPDESIPRVK